MTPIGVARKNAIPQDVLLKSLSGVDVNIYVDCENHSDSGREPVTMKVAKAKAKAEGRGCGKSCPTRGMGGV